VKTLLFFLMLISSSTILFGQKGYAKDSLQIKLYADITYSNNQPKKINVRKVFCDYCSEAQIEIVKQEGWRRAYNERMHPENRLLNGIKKLTIIMRFAKADFKKLNQ